MTSSPLPAEHPVLRQLTAYNAHDLDAFVACFDADIRLTDSDGTVRASGWAELRAVYEPTLQIPELHVEVINRIAVDDWVVDHEDVTGRDGRRFHAIVAYHLRDGAIIEMRALK
jgi:hypothetical protein